MRLTITIGFLFFSVLALKGQENDTVQYIGGQDDDTVQYIHGLPQTGEDTVTQSWPKDDVAPADSIVQLSADQLPRDLVKSLDGNPLYKGWKNQTLQIDKNTGMYWIHFREQRRVRSYAFDESGHVVSLKEVTLPEK